MTGSMTGRTPPPELVDHDRKIADPAVPVGTTLAERVQRIVDTLPPPSPAQRARIAALLAPGPYARSGDEAA